MAGHSRLSKKYAQFLTTQVYIVLDIESPRTSYEHEQQHEGNAKLCEVH